MKILFIYILNFGIKMCPKLSIFLTIQKPDTVNRHSFFKKNCGRIPHSKFYKTKQRITERGIQREREREREREFTTNSIQH
jgi:hypothetical protein